MPLVCALSPISSSARSLCACPRPLGIVGRRKEHRRKVPRGPAVSAGRNFVRKIDPSRLSTTALNRCDMLVRAVAPGYCLDCPSGEDSNPGMVTSCKGQKRAWSFLSQEHLVSTSPDWEAVCQVPDFVFPPIGEQLIVHSVLLT